MDRNQTPQQREMMYCHQCENEWYRDEHGLECPECHSDFTEVIEANNDPREDEHHIPGEPEFRHGGGGGFGVPAPDPDEDDIDNLRWEQTGPGTYRVRGRYNMDLPLNRQGQMQGEGQGQGGMGGGLMGMVGNLLQGMVGQQQGQGQQPGQHGQPEAPSSPERAASPQAGGQRTPGNGTHIRHGTGPGFSYTIATSSNANFNGNLFPRNAHGPQPFQPQPNHLDQMLAQMFMNVGAMPGQPGMRGHGPGMHNHPLHDHDPFGPPGGDGFMFGGPGGFANILNMFGGPPGQAGDAVYTQEALDRIMTQLMEQHQSGNAPGPASEAAIKSLPKRAVTAKDQGSEGKAECSICMDEVPLGEEVTELPCHHWFHHECVKAWLSEHDTCPHCRQGIMPKDANSSQGGEGGTSRNPGQEPLNDMRSPEFTRPQGGGGMPGAFPFPQQGDGSRGNPYSVPESPGRGGAQGRGSNGGSMFGRMREAFGGGGNGSQGEQSGR